MQKQKIRGMVLAAVVCCVSLSSCGAAEKTAQQTDLPAIIIGSDNYPPYNYENVDGKPTGIDVDLATEAFRRMGYRAVFTYIDWEKKKELVDSGKIDCIWGSFSIDGREEEYRWSAPYMMSRQVVAVNRDSEIKNIGGFGGQAHCGAVHHKAGGTFSFAYGCKTSCPARGVFHAESGIDLSLPEQGLCGCDCRA